MPVVGHAFLGLATGLAVRPRLPPGATERPPGHDLWASAAVALAYLPDVAGQLLALAGWAGARAFSHSLLFVAAVASGVALGLFRLRFAPLPRALALSLGSLLGHLLLDLLQATDRTPLWPFSSWRASVPLLPADPLAELGLFGACFLVFLACRRGREDPPRAGAPERRRVVSRSAWASGAAAVLLVLGALGTHGLRATREAQLYEAHRLLAARDYRGVLRAVAQAARWPSTAKAGRLDYLRGAAWEGLGDRRLAETHYLLSYVADPDYFWCVADLALFYMRSASPQERRRMSNPYLARLQNDFRGHPEQAEYAGRIQRQLTRDGGGRAHLPP